MTNLENYYPNFLCRKPDSNFMKFNKVVNKSIEELLSVEEMVKNYFTLSKKLLVWKEQKEPYNYDIHFIADYKDIKYVMILKDGILISLETNVDNFHMVLHEVSPLLIPDNHYSIEVTLKNGVILKKGFPENVTPKGNEFDFDYGLDCIGKLLDCPRRTYKSPLPPSDYPKTEPSYCNLQVESDYNYMNRLSEYSQRYWEEPLICLKIWQYYNLNSKLENRSEKLCTINESYIEPDKTEKIVTGDYIATKQNYNAYCYDLIIDGDNKIPANLKFTNMAEIQKLINKYAPITKRIFIDGDSEEKEEGIVLNISTNVELISKSIVQSILTCNIVDNTGSNVDGVLIIDGERRIESVGGLIITQVQNGTHSLVVIPVEYIRYHLYFDDVTINSDTTLTIPLSLRATEIVRFNIVVVDDDDYEPIKSATITIDGTTTTTTDSQGYAVIVIEEGNHIFKIEAEEYETNEFKAYILMNQRDINVNLQPVKSNLKFKIVDENNDIPIASAHILIENLPVLITDADGYTAIDLRKGEDYEFSVFAENYAKFTDVVTLTEDKEITIPLPFTGGTNKHIPYTVHLIDKETNDTPASEIWLTVDEQESYKMDPRGYVHCFVENLGNHSIKGKSDPYVGGLDFKIHIRNEEGESVTFYVDHPEPPEPSKNITVIFRVQNKAGKPVQNYDTWVTIDNKMSYLIPKKQGEVKVPGIPAGKEITVTAKLIGFKWESTNKMTFMKEGDYWAWGPVPDG